MSVNDADSWIAEELDFIKAAMNNSIPVLGICFGAQLLARALGGSVAPGPIFEVGMVPVTLTDAGATDPVFRQLPPTFQVFQWHGEGIILPSEIPSLVASEDFPVQAFRVRDRWLRIVIFTRKWKRRVFRPYVVNVRKMSKKEGYSPDTIQVQAAPYLPLWHQWADRLIGHLIM